jgi:hypothetical protein
MCANEIGAGWSPTYTAPESEQKSRADLDEDDVALDLARRHPAQPFNVEATRDSEVAHTEGHHAHRGIHG